MKKLLLIFLGFLSLGADDIDTSWVDGVIEDLLQALWDVTLGSNGVLVIIYNLLPVVGNNSMSIEIWFILAVFGGLLIFLKWGVDIEKIMEEMLK